MGLCYGRVNKPTARFRNQIVRNGGYLARMDIILIHGLWLDGSTWDAVVPHLEAAGHRPHALTLPGMESKDADRSGITLSDHVDAVVAENALSLQPPQPPSDDDGNEGGGNGKAKGKGKGKGKGKD